MRDTLETGISHLFFVILPLKTGISHPVLGISHPILGVFHSNLPFIFMQTINESLIFPLIIPYYSTSIPFVPLE